MHSEETWRNMLQEKQDQVDLAQEEAQRLQAEIEEVTAELESKRNENARLRQIAGIAESVDLEGDPFDGNVLDEIPAGAALKLAHLIAAPSPIREARNLFTATGTQN